MRQRLRTTLTIILLVAAAARLASLTRTEVRRLDNAKRQAAAVPSSGSHYGVGSEGQLISALPIFKYRVLFVLRSSTLSKDIDYWNAVHDVVGSAESRIDWWGICDAGQSCAKHQDRAKFSIVGFLDPYQMRVMTSAYSDGTALFYQGQALKGRVPIGASTTDTATRVVSLLR